MNYPTQTDNVNEATTYNGWANYETWNVSLWIQNDSSLYDMAGVFIRSRKYYGNGPATYQAFTKFLVNNETPDGVSFTHKALDHAQLDEMLSELG